MQLVIFKFINEYFFKLLYILGSIEYNCYIYSNDSVYGISILCFYGTFREKLLRIRIS